MNGLGAIWYAMWLKVHDPVAHSIGTGCPLTASLDSEACRRMYEEQARRAAWARINRQFCDLIHRRRT